MADRITIACFAFVCAVLVVVLTLNVAETLQNNIDMPTILNQTEFEKTGYVTDIDFIGGGFGAPVQRTIIHFSDGDVVTLQYWKTEIPKQQNITLRYHDNGFGRYFLDGFTMVRSVVG